MGFELLLVGILHSAVNGCHDPVGIAVSGDLPRGERVIELQHLGRVQTDCVGAYVLFQIRAPLGSRNRHDAVSLMEQPRERDLSDTHPRVAPLDPQESWTARKGAIGYDGRGETSTAPGIADFGPLGATLEELIQCVSRKFGFRSTSAQLRDVIEDRTRRLLKDGALEWRGEHIASAR